MKNIGLKEKAKVIDLTRKVGTVETLTEARINCTKEEKVRNCLCEPFYEKTGFLLMRKRHRSAVQ